MISFIRGELSAIEGQRVIVDVSGVGYGIQMSEKSVSMLPPIGTEIKIHTYLNVREDAMQLYGFLKREDLEVFRLLIGVSGIGPKGGQNILSCLTPDELRFAVLTGDVKAISAAPGIGKRIAEKLIVELKDKFPEITLPQNDPEDSMFEEAVAGEEIDQIRSDAVQALVSLGYGSAESIRAVRQTSLSCVTVEEILKEALKYLF